MDNLDITDLIGIRFKNRGRSINEGFDCYGLAIEVSKRLGHELKDVFYETSNSITFSKTAESVIKDMSQNVCKTEEMQLGNLIVFSDERGHMVHIGVILDEEYFIHCSSNGVSIVLLRDYYRKNWQVYKWLQ